MLSDFPVGSELNYQVCERLTEDCVSKNRTDLSFGLAKSVF